MTKELLENLLIEFDEMGYEPTTLCDTEREIESFRSRLKQVLDYLKSIDNSNHSKALKCLERIGKYPVITDYEKDIVSTIKELLPNSFDIIKQALTTKSKKEQAWDIVVKKNVDIALLKREKSVDSYNFCASLSPIKRDELTKEEFNLLKEW